VIKLDRTRDPDGVFDLINEQHAIHVGISVQSDIIFYGLIKTLSIKYDRKPGDKYDRWPSITVEEFEKATSNWVRRNQYIGDQLEYWLKILKDRGYLRIHIQYNGEISMAFTRLGVHLILNTVGLYTNMESISY
jgi:hypothetical protein